MRGEGAMSKARIWMTQCARRRGEEQNDCAGLYAVGQVLLYAGLCVGGRLCAGLRYGAMDCALGCALGPNDGVLDCALGAGTVRLTVRCHVGSPTWK